MNKLEIIEQAIETSTRVIVTNKPERYSLNGIRQEKNEEGKDEGLLVHEMHFYVAPKRVLYSAKELNEFMNGLFPSLQPDETFPSEEKYDGDLFYGQMRFREIVGNGSKSRTVTIREKRLQYLLRVNNPVVTDYPIENFLRLLSILVHPHEDIARFYGNHHEGIEDKELNDRFRESFPSYYDLNEARVKISSLRTYVEK